MDMAWIVTGLLGLMIGGGVGWLLASQTGRQQRLLSQATLEQERQRAERAETEQRAVTSALEAERKAHAGTQQKLTEEAVRRASEKEAAEKRLQELTALREQLQDSVKALAADALNRNNQAFLELAETRFAKLQTAAKGDLAQRQQAVKELVSPLQEALQKVDTKVQALEKAREGAYAGLREQVQQLANVHGKLAGETSALVDALRRPQVRGQWGELQLQRTIEFAGMLEEVDFQQQASVTTDEDARQRPDVIVKLPNGRVLVIDAKAPMEAYLTALQAPDVDTQRTEMTRHARHIRTHAKQLGSKNYAKQFADAPEFVVLFVPGEAMFSAALEADAELVEFAAKQNVVLASPTTLIALLRAVHHGWQQARLAEEAQKISQLGRDLYDRLGTMGKHFGDLGKALERSVGKYNEAMRSLDSRVFVTARKMAALAPVGDSLVEAPAPLEKTPALPRSEELDEADEENQKS